MSWIDLDYVAKRVAALMNIEEEELWREGRRKELVWARSLFCFWAVRKLDVSMTALARQLNTSNVPVSKSVVRGAETVLRGGLELS